MTKFTDPLGREFVALSTLSALLSLSTKQIHRHIRDKGLLSIKRGQQRFIFKDDVLKEYPAITASMLDRDIMDTTRDITDINGTSEYISNVPNVPNVPKEIAVNVYSPDKKQDLLIQNMEQVRSVISQLEKSIANLNYIQRDTKAITLKLDKTNSRNTKIEGVLATLVSKMSHLERQTGHRGHLIGLGVLALIIAGLIAGGIFGIVKFQNFYQNTQAEYKNLLNTKDTQLSSLGNKLNETVLLNTVKMGEKELEIERLRGINKHLADTVTGLQDPKNKRRGGF